MSMQDPIADMLVYIKNGQAVQSKSVTMPSSKIKISVAEVLKSEGYINDLSVAENDGKPRLTITLKYHNEHGVIEKLKRVSKPSLRIYRGVKDLPKVLGGLGVAIISTPKGVMSDRAAKAAGIGGEVLCTVE